MRVAALLLAGERLGRFAWLGLVPAGLLLLAPSASGHASVSGGLAFVADVAHVAAAAVWVGGLAALVLALVWAGAQRWELAVSAVPRFSVLAVGAVSVLLVSGTTSGYLEVRALRGLWETTYGQLLLAKVALVLPLLALGLYNNRRAVPRLRARLASAAERTRFLRTAGVELALMVAIVSVTAVLVSEPPARAEVAPRGPYATTAQLGELELNLVVDPAAAGPNQIHLYLTDRSGQPTNVDEASVSATLASREIGPLKLRAHRAGPGHFAVHGAQLALAGDWQLRVETRRGEFDAAATTVSIPIRKEASLMKKTLTLLAVCGALVGVPAASAHVTVNPNEVAADSFSRFAVRVPNERPNAATTKVVVRLPQGLFFVSFQPKPGWKRTRDDGEAGPAGRAVRRDADRASRDRHLGGRQDRPGRVRRVRAQRQGPERPRQDARLPRQPDVLERRGRSLDRRSRLGNARLPRHARPEGSGGSSGSHGAADRRDNRRFCVRATTTRTPTSSRSASGSQACSRAWPRSPLTLFRKPKAA